MKQLLATFELELRLKIGLSRNHGKERYSAAVDVLMACSIEQHYVRSNLLLSVILLEKSNVFLMLKIFEGGSSFFTVL